MEYCAGDVELCEGMSLKLVHEEDNEHDPNAIAVYAGGKKIGYVANNGFTVFEMTSSASELKAEIDGTAEARYLFYLSRYTDVQFHIGRIVR